MLCSVMYAIVLSCQVDGNRVKNVAGMFFLNNVCMFLAALYYTVTAFSAETQVFMREHLAGANRLVS